MFGYCGRTSMSSRARGSSATTRSAVSRSTATCSASLSSSKSRTIVRIVAVPAPPSTAKTWMKPSRPEVASGVRSAGSAARIRPGQRRGVDELAGGEARVHVDAVDDEVGARRGERLVLELAHRGAVERVRADGAEALDVEERGALPHLLVGREADADRRPRELGMGREVRDRGHHLGHAGLVVGAEQRVAARGDDVVADRVAQLGHPLGLEHGPAARQRDVAAVVVAVHERLDPAAGLVRARVQVGEQADDGRALHGRGQRGEDVALRVLLGVAEPDLAQLLHQHPPELELPRGARAARAVARRLRVDADVAQEAVEDGWGELLGER